MSSARIDRNVAISRFRSAFLRTRVDSRDVIIVMATQTMFPTSGQNTSNMRILLRSFKGRFQGSDIFINLYFYSVNLGCKTRENTLCLFSYFLIFYDSKNPQEHG